MLDVVGLTKTYKERIVLDDVSFSVEPGKVTGLLGPNGSGKSTTLHILAGLIPATLGTCAINEHPLTSTRYRDALGFCPDDLPQPELLTAREYLELIQGIRRIRISDETITLLLTGFRLEHAHNDLIGSYSHGMKRKLQVIGALLHRPDILVLDEPFRGLDPESSAIMHELVAGYARNGHSVLVSTHDLLLAEKLCQDLVVLQDGRVVAAGSTPDIVSRQGHGTLEESFLAATGLDEVARDSSRTFFEGLEQIPVGRSSS